MFMKSQKHNMNYKIPFLCLLVRRNLPKNFQNCNIQIKTNIVKHLQALMTIQLVRHLQIWKLSIFSKIQSKKKVPKTKISKLQLIRVIHLLFQKLSRAQLNKECTWGDSLQNHLEGRSSRKNQINQNRQKERTIIIKMT